MSSSEIIFQEVEHRLKFLINQHSVILDQTFKKNFNYFLRAESKFFIMCSKEKILRSRFLPFLDNFKYAWATIVALCSQGLHFKIYTVWFLKWKKWIIMAECNVALSRRNLARWTNQFVLNIDSFGLKFESH